MGKQIESRCPRCGASPSHQRYNPRGSRMVVDLSKLGVSSTLNPVDGVVCPRCGQGFRVVHLETFDDGLLNFKDEFECAPRYCPMCGRRLKEVGR